MKMGLRNMPSSYYAILGSFAIFFGCLNVAVLTFLLNHPFQSNLWFVGTAIGLVMLLISIRMMRIQQRDLIEKRREQELKEI